MSADIEQAVSSIAGVGPLPGLANTWKWSPSPRFTFALALGDDGEHAFQINCLDSYDEELVRSVLEFSRAHASQLLNGGPFALVPGFRCEPYGFDAVAGVSPTVHRYHVGRNDALNDLVVAVFPAYTCEFSGTETLDEAGHRFRRMLHPSVMNRGPSPYLRMRYDNVKTGAGSVGTDRGFTTPEVLLRELYLLEASAESFVEFENFRCEVYTVSWLDDRWTVSGFQPGHLSREDLEPWVQGLLGCPNEPSRVRSRP